MKNYREFSTINKIFSGATKNPRYSTLLAIEEVILSKSRIPFTYNENSYQPMMVQESASPYICDTDKLTDSGCSGAPEWIIEIISESNFKHDYVTKMMLYQTAGVKEYWIVDPKETLVYVYDFENTKNSKTYSFDETITCITLEGLQIKISL